MDSDEPDEFDRAAQRIRQRENKEKAFGDEPEFNLFRCLFREAVENHKR